MLKLFEKSNYNDIEIIIWCLIKEVYLPFKFVVGGCGIFVELDGIPSSVIRIKGQYE